MTKAYPLLYIQPIVKCIFDHVYTVSTLFFSSRPIYRSAESYWLILANHRYIGICILVGRCVFFNVFFFFFCVCVCAGGCHRCWGRASERSCSCQMFIRLLLLIWQTTSLRDSKGLCSRSTWLMPLFFFFFYFLTQGLVIVILQSRLIKRLGLWESRSVADFSHTATFSFAKWVLRHKQRSL